MADIKQVTVGVLGVTKRETRVMEIGEHNTVLPIKGVSNVLHLNAGGLEGQSWPC